MKVTARVSDAPARFAIVVLAALLLATSLVVGLQALPPSSDGAVLGYTAYSPTAGATATAITGGSSGNAARSLTIARPAAEDGDLLLAQITFEKGRDAGTDAQITPAGWTLVLRTNAQRHPNGTDLGQAIFYRIVANASADTGPYAFPFRQAVKAAGGITAFSGVHTDHPAGPIVASSGNSGSSATLTAPGVNATENSTVVGFFGMKKKATTLGAPLGMTAHYSLSNPQDVSIRAASQAFAAPAATGNKVSTPSPNNSDKWVAQLVVLRGPVTIQFLNVSDWHAALDPNIAGIGSAAAISTYWKTDRLAHPTLTLTAGDDFGATPPLSGFFNEEPAILAQRLMGIQVGTFGNHNFDRGIAHLQQMINLAGAPTSADAPGTPFKYVSANLQGRDGPGGLTGVQDFAMFDVGEVKVAVVGVTNPEAPSLVLPGSFGPIVPQPAAPAAMAAQVAARAAGADVVVAIGHLGVRGFEDGQPFGELIDFANAVSGFDVIFGDHTDIQFSGTVNGQLVHENRSFGVTYAKTLLTINPSSGEVVGSSASFVTPTAAAVTPDPAIVAMLAPIRAELSEILDVPIGVATASFPRGGNLERREEVALGNLVADGMRWKYGTQLGYMNSGGIRTPFPNPAYLPVDHTLRRPSAGYAAGPPFDLVLGDVYSVLPFNNAITTRTVTGDQLWAMLENGVSRIDSVSGLGTDGRFPQISGFKFTFDFGNPTGCTGVVNTASWECSTASRVTVVTLNDGTPILPDGTTYTMALPNFVNLGGDNYTMLNDGQGTSLESDAVVMNEYLDFLGSPFTPVVDGRITKLP